MFDFPSLEVWDGFDWVDCTMELYSAGEQSFAVVEVDGRLKTVSLDKIRNKPIDEAAVYCREYAKKMGGNAYYSDGKYFISVILGGREYNTYRESWTSLASAIGILMDMKERFGN